MCVLTRGQIVQATIAQARAQAFQQAYALAAMTPGCVEVVVMPALGPMPVAVVWGKPSVPRVPRRKRDQ